MNDKECEQNGFKGFKSKIITRKGANHTVELYQNAIITLYDLDTPGNTVQSKFSVVCEKEHISSPTMGLGALSRVFDFYAQGEDVYCSVIQNAKKTNKIRPFNLNT